MRSSVEALILMLEIYLALGALSAVAFLTVGIDRVMPHAGRITPGARIVLLPAAILLWPWTLLRWVATR